MRKRVWKVGIPVTDEQTVYMPEGAIPLAVGDQNNEPSSVQMWILANPDAKLVGRRILIRGTGHPADEVEAEQYVGTVITLGGQLVWHVFDGGETERSGDGRA